MPPFALLAALALFQGSIAWTPLEGVSIPVPPAEHPRLYLRARDLADLQRRTTHPALKPLWERLQALGEKDPARGVEAGALRYLLTRDEGLARQTIARTLRLLHETRFDPRQQDVTRPIGRLLVSGAIVYNWWYRGHAFHQGSAYAETRVSSEMYPLWIFARMGAGAVYDPALQYVPYQWIYLRRPDGQLLRAGDGQSRPPKLRSLLNASFYQDPYVLADYLRDPEIDAASLIFAFLWRDPDLEPRPVSSLPLSRYMGSPYGWMVARSGWDDESVIAEMKVNLYNFNNHQHLDAGAFQLYYKGPLAIDSGLYEGSSGGYGSEHDVNYNKRTIAHNSLLIHDPAETFARGNRAMHNDGGQRFPNGWREPRNLEDMLANYRTGEVLGQGFGPDPQKPAYTYMKGDLTQAYSAKVTKVERSFVFLNLAPHPVRAALLVFDRVVAANPQFKKYWLLHSMEQPRIEADTITVAPVERGWRGKLVSRVLLPAGAAITPSGGPGREFEVFGRNFPNQPTRGKPEDYELGAWRVEVSPREPAASDLFLNVMQVMDRDTNPGPVRSLAHTDLAGAELAGASIFFNKTGGPLNRPLTFRIATNRFLVAGLAPGAWRIRREGRRSGAPVRVGAEAGVLWFEGPPGSYALQPEKPSR